jgi:hypothetical protein
MPETLGVLFVEGERIVEVIPEGSRPITAKLRAHVQERLANRQLLLAKENTYEYDYSCTYLVASKLFSVFFPLSSRPFPYMVGSADEIDVAACIL